MLETDVEQSDVARTLDFVKESKRRCGKILVRELGLWPEDERQVDTMKLALNEGVATVSTRNNEGSQYSKRKSHLTI